jgi:nitroimidazol reductase NimA-like FMN-containing flavoprotein (pyridoxamine 5'-phosphate oxidase superfamily)
MTTEERDAFLGVERTCRVGTVGVDGPHVTALWFVWHRESVWLTSLVRSQRWTDVERDPRLTVLVDAGEGYAQLRGVEIRGRAKPVGEVPRTGQVVEVLVEPERLFGGKYSGGSFTHDGRHGWLQVIPDKIVSWDFRKLG